MTASSASSVPVKRQAVTDIWSTPLASPLTVLFPEDQGAHAGRRHPGGQQAPNCLAISAVRDILLWFRDLDGGQHVARRQGKHVVVVMEQMLDHDPVNSRGRIVPQPVTDLLGGTDEHGLSAGIVGGEELSGATESLPASDELQQVGD